MTILLLLFFSSALLVADQVAIAGGVQIAGTLGLSSATPAIPSGATIEILFDEASGTVTDDNCDGSPPAHCGGTVDDSGTLTIGNGVWGADYIDFGTNGETLGPDSVDLGTGAFSVSVWAWFDSESSNKGFFGQTSAVSEGFDFRMRHGVTANEIWFRVFGTGGGYICREGDHGSEGTGAWHNITVVYDNGTDATAIKIYIDGVESTSYASCDSATFTARIDATSGLEIGTTWWAQSPIDGRMSHLRIWPLELSSSDAVDITNHGRVP